MLSAATLAAFLAAGCVYAQQDTFPHHYAGEPKGDYGPNWQEYFEVTQSLPNVTFKLDRNWAGNIAVNRTGFPNNTLFFWGFEKEIGSLTAKAEERQDEPWGIWLNGGPGSSSMIGMISENGPIQINSNNSLRANDYSWHKLADYFWLDQPVGVGFSTASKNGYILDEDQMATDFWGFVSNLVKIFPSLASRPLYLTGESYAGTYIPYITKAYFSLNNPPTKLVKIAIGDGAMGNFAQFEDAPVLTVLETFPQLIGYDPDVYNYFAEQTHLCGFDLNLTYPQQGGHFPTLLNGWESDEGFVTSLTKDSLKNRKTALHALAAKAAQTPPLPARRQLGRRSLEGRANGTIDPMYRCALFEEMWDYAVNYTVPWTSSSADAHGSFSSDVDVYNIPDALFPEAAGDIGSFLNNPKAVAALHAPTSKEWEDSVGYVFQGRVSYDPSMPPVTFFDDLAKNASAHNVSVVIYSGNDDSLVPHWSSEVIIQNTTFSGTQGFTRKPSTEWTTDDGQFAGIVHQERNWTYALVYGAGHLVPQQKPAAAYVLLREFILGNNQTGLVTSDSASTFGGENGATNLTGSAGDVLRAGPEIYVGAVSTTSTVVAPSASIAAWDAFAATRWSDKAVASGSSTAPESTSSSVGGGKNGASSLRMSMVSLMAAIVAITWMV